MASTASQAFCLKLNSHQSHMIEAFQRLYNDEVLVDCTLSCAGGTLKAHKLVLSACSPYFTNLFATFTNPYQYPVVIIKDMPFADLKAIIEFMYRGEVTVPQSILPSVLESAKTLSITGLCDIKLANFSNQKPEAGGLFGGRSKKRRRRSSRDSTSVIGAIDDVASLDASGGEENEEVANQSVTASPIKLPDNNDSLNKNEAEGNGDNVEESDNEIEFETNDPDQETISASQPSLRLPSTSSSGGLKQMLRVERIQRMSDVAGGPSFGRKLWSDEETNTLLKVWDEESARVWASAGKKILSFKRIAELLTEEGIDRDLSQVEGKVKALKRDFRAVRAEKAVPAVSQRMASCMDRLEVILSREGLE